MQYHARALSLNGAIVDFVGYSGARAAHDIENHPQIRIHRLPSSSVARHSKSRVLFFIISAWRALFESVRLLLLLGWRLPRPDLILVQTPPSLPTLIIAWLVARSRRARFVIDWHNFGDRMLALRLGDNSLLVRLVGRYERRLARHADAHLVVSAAMRDVLENHWGVAPIGVLYDRPADRFKLLSQPDRARARRELLKLLDLPADAEQTIAVSPTSWTADEDYDLLLEGLVQYDKSESAGDLLILLTGDGPRRSEYEERIATLRLQRVAIRTAWLNSDDYPRLLAAADLGLCLHRSASGVDLPMKVVDCIGAGLPVFALEYGPCVREMIQPGVHGELFKEAGELARLLQQTVGRRADGTALKTLRRNVAGQPAETWQDGWQREAAHLLIPEAI
jgi:beta-1,4-mannosyltransferase